MIVLFNLDTHILTSTASGSPLSWALIGHSLWTALNISMVMSLQYPTLFLLIPSCDRTNIYGQNTSPQQLHAIFPLFSWENQCWKQWQQPAYLNICSPKKTTKSNALFLLSIKLTITDGWYSALYCCISHSWSQIGALANIIALIFSLVTWTITYIALQSLLKAFLGQFKNKINDYCYLVSL